MKMFKKLMAVALAGVMTLAILTGCSNYKNMVQMMNDAAKRIDAGFTVSEDADLTKKAKTIATKLEELDAKKLSQKELAEKSEAILKEVLGDKYAENYTMAVTKPVDAKNSFAKDYYTMQNAQLLVSQLKKNLDEKHTVSKIGIATVHDATDDTDYLFVLAQLEKKEAK